MSVAWDNVPDEQSDEISAEDDSGREPGETTLETIDLLSEVYIAVGVAVPCFLMVISLVAQMTSPNFQWVIKVTPVISIVATATVVGVIQYTLSGVNRTPDLQKQLTMYQVVIGISVIVLFFVMAILNQSFLSPLSKVGAEVIGEPYLLLTISAVAFPSGYLLGYFKRPSIVSSILSGGVFTGLVSGAYLFLFL